MVYIFTFSVVQPVGGSDITTLISNMLRRIDRAGKVFFFPLVTTEVISDGCLKDCRLAVFNLLFPAIDYFLAPVSEHTQLLTRTLCAFEILWCNYILKDWKDLYMIVPYLVNELSWKNDFSNDILVPLSSYSCLVTALYFTGSHPDMAFILDIIVPKIQEKLENFKISYFITRNLILKSLFSCDDDY